MGDESNAYDDDADEIGESKPTKVKGEKKAGSSRFVASRQWLQQARERRARMEAEEVEREAPLVDASRPIVDAAHVAFLEDPERWSDAIIVIVEGGIVGHGIYRATTTKEAMWTLAGVMAYFRPEDNPFTEALRHLGGRDISSSRPEQADQGFKVKIKDPVAFSIDRIARMSDPRTNFGLRLSSNFPEGATPEQAAAELRRCYSLATGKEFARIPSEPERNDGVPGETTLTPKEFQCGKAMYELSAFDHGSRVTNPMLAKKVGDKYANGNYVAHAKSSLVKKGIAESCGGQKGGSWLTPQGQEYFRNSAE